MSIRKAVAVKTSFLLAILIVIALAAVLPRAEAEEGCDGPCPAADATPKIEDIEREVYGPQKSEPVKLGDEAGAFGKAKYDVKKKTVIIEGEIKIRDSQGEPIELLAAAVGSDKMHETVFACDVKPSDLHKALVSVGLIPSSYGVQERDEIKDIVGDKVAVWVEWTKDNATLRVRSEDLFLDARFDRPWERWGWVFVGSLGPVQDPKTGQVTQVYRPNIEKSLIVNYHSPNTVLDNPRAVGAFDEIFLTNSEFIPPVGTKVRLVFKPVTETEIISGLISDADAIVKKITACRTEPAAGNGKLPGQFKETLEYYEAKKKWLEEKALPIAKELDKEKRKIIGEILPRLKALEAELKKAMRAGDRDGMEATMRKIDAVMAAKDEAERMMDVLHHRLWSLVAQKELAEGRERKVDEGAMALLDRMITHYKDREEIVGFAHELSKTRVEIIRLKREIEAITEPEKKKEAAMQLARYEAELQVLENKILRETLEPLLRQRAQNLARINKEMDDDEVRDDPELLESYQKEFAKERAEKEQIERQVGLVKTRIGIAELRREMRLAELAGETPDAREKEALAALEKQERKLNAGIELHILKKQLDEVEWQLSLAVQTGDEGKIAALRAERTNLHNRIEMLEKESGD